MGEGMTLLRCLSC